MIQYETEILKHFKIPAIPLKKWDGVSSFKDGVAVVELAYNGDAYAACTFDADTDKSPRIVKVFAQEQFTKLIDVFVVPSYMDTEVEDSDLDDDSKDAAKRLIEEADDAMGGSDAKTEIEKIGEQHEYFFDNIHNDEEATAFISSYNKQNGIRGNAPRKHETIIARLAVIYADIQKTKQ